MISSIKYILRRIQLILYRIKNFFLKPQYPQNKDGKILIHLGCGDINCPAFINVDSRFFPHIHHIHNIEYLPMFNDEFADLMYASHTLEHVSMLKVSQVLTEWKRILKKSGILRISVPDFNKIIDIYKKNDEEIESIWMPLLGSQEYKENSHYSLFNEKFLTKLFLEAGFSEVRKWDPAKSEFHNFDDWASRNILIGEIQYPISLNLEAIK